MSVQDIRTSNDLALVKKEACLVIIDWHATWCGPCKAIAPVFKKLAEDPKNKGARFIRIDVDEVSDAAAAAGVTAMPTFQCYSKGVKVDEMKGSRAAELDAMVRKAVAKYGDKGDGGDQSGGSGSGATGSLNGNIDIKQLELSNATEGSQVRALFDPSSKTVVTSDSDEQLMLFIPFQESCKVHSLVLRVNPDKVSHAPSRLRLFVNKPNILSFDDALSLPATQEIEGDAISYNDKGEATVALRYVKFQKVISLVVFIEANEGDEETTMLRSVDILGEVGANNASGAIKAVEED